MAIIQDITIFTDDDVTPLLGVVASDGTITEASFSTDPLHPRPFMKTITSDIVNAEVKFKDGTSIMGGCSVELVDVPTVPGNQVTGAVTAILASATTGNTQLLMRRAVVRQQDPDGNMQVVFDGVLLDPTLDTSTYVTYRFGLRSITERGRQEPIFMHATTSSIVPPGTTTGYGTSSARGQMLIGPAGWEYGIFRMDANSPVNGIYTGRIDLHNPARYSTQWWSDWSDSHRLALQQLGAPMPVYDPTTAGFLEVRFPMVNVQWRATGTSNAFKTVSNMPMPMGAHEDTSNVFIITDRGLVGSSVKGHGNALSYITLTSRTLSDLPTDGQAVDVRVTNNGPPTDSAPLLLDTTFGQLLADIYDGKYSYDPNTAPRVRYNAAAMAAFQAGPDGGQPARAIIKQSEPDLLKWVADNIYKPLGYAPAENEHGEIVPISFFLPDATVPLVTLDDTNVVSCDWTHTRDEAVTSTLFTYFRDIVLPPTPNTATASDFLHGRGFDMSNDFERLASQEVQIRFLNVGGTTLFGDQPITYAPVTVRAFTLSMKAMPFSGDVGDEIGAKIAQKTCMYALDRFSQGAQKCTAVVLASDPIVRNAAVGDWVVLGASWIPDYVRGTRGANRLMQIVQIRTPSQTSRQFTLLDAGPHGQPMAQPTLANIRQTNGIVTADVSNIPAGGAAVVEYAVSATQPGTTSPLWLLAARVTTAQSVSTPPLGNGQEVWVRATGVAVGRRRSAPTTPLSIAIPVLPAVSGVEVVVDQTTGAVSLQWVPGNNVNGLRIAYAVTSDPTTNPALTTILDVAAQNNSPAALGVTLAQGQFVVLTVTPYSGFTGSAVTGTVGIPSGRVAEGFLRGDLVTGGAQIIPTTKYTISPATGAMSVTAKTSNPSATALYGVVRLDRAPTQAEVLAGATAPVTSAGGVLTFAGPTVPTGSPFWIGTLQAYADGSDGDVAVTPGVFLGVNATPLPQVTVGAAVIQSDKVTFPLIVDADCTELFVYAKQVQTPPSQPVDVEELVTLPFKTLDVGKDGLAVGQQYLLSIPLLGPSLSVLATFLGYNALGQAGTKVNMIAVGAGGAAPAKPVAPTIDTPTHTASTIGATVHDHNGTAPDDFIVFVDNVAGPPTMWTGGAGGAVGWFIQGIQPSRTYKVEVLVRKAGIQSDRSGALSITTDAAAASGSGGGTTTNGKLTAPVIIGNYDAAGAADLTVTNNPPWPSGTIFHCAWVESPGTPTTANEDAAAASNTMYLSSAFDRAPTPDTRRYMVWATAPGYTASDPSNVVSVTMPGYTLL